MPLDEGSAASSLASHCWAFIAAALPHLRS
jgi:hypothetical protein